MNPHLSLFPLFLCRVYRTWSVYLGLLNYVETQQKKNSLLLFPAWNPVNDRASTQAEKWFCQFLKSIGLRDETPFKRIVGMHAFRSTIVNRAQNTLTGQPGDGLSSEPIVGHAHKTQSRVHQNYAGELSIANISMILEAINFGFEPEPVVA